MEGKMTIASVVMVLCGVCSFFLDLIRRAFNIVETVKNVALSNLDYSEVNTWTRILLSVRNLVIIYNHSFGIVTIIQIVSGIIGIIFVIAVHSKKSRQKAEKVRFIPFLCGVVSCVLGVLSFLLTLVFKSTPIILCILMFVTLIVVPMIFTKCANRFRKNECEGEKV